MTITLLILIFYKKLMSAKKNKHIENIELLKYKKTIKSKPFVEIHK